VNGTRRIVFLLVAAFIALIALSWLDEFMSPRPHWREAMGESILTFGVAAVVLFWTLRWTKRLVYLENFPRVCAWCKKVKCFEGEWIPVEKFFRERFHAKTSHGICPACAHQEMKGHDEMIARRSLEILRELEIKSGTSAQISAGRGPEKRKA
jgi:hypothetical protein